jgi:cholesterol transport system auxiliary component
MPNKLFLYLVVTLVALFTLSGCAVNTNVNRYSINSSCVRQPCCGSPFTLFVANTTAQPGYDTDQMIYLQCAYELKAFSRNRWVAPPNEMVNPLIAQSLRNTCYFKAVVTAPFAGQSHYRLETKLVKLQQEFFCCPSLVRMVIQATLIETCCREVIGQKVFEVVMVAPKRNPYGGVIAANQATEILLRDIANFVVCSIEQRPALPPPVEKFEQAKTK